MIIIFRNFYNLDGSNFLISCSLIDAVIFVPVLFLQPVLRTALLQPSCSIKILQALHYFTLFCIKR